MSQQEGKSRIEHWANQTVLFVLILESQTRDRVPREVYEQRELTAAAIVNRMLGESIAECGADATVVAVSMCLVGKVLDWVAARRSP